MTSASWTLRLSPLDIRFPMVSFTAPSGWRTGRPVIDECNTHLKSDHEYFWARAYLGEQRVARGFRQASAWPSQNSLQKFNHLYVDFVNVRAVVQLLRCELDV